ncbi:MAG: hypothetical protein FWD87_07725 [Spirochaetaceae bacterium]|nr:hypothetical protein [Spirochaetaceae bacterium]
MKNKLIILQVLLLISISLKIGFFSCALSESADISHLRGVNFILHNKFSSISEDLAGWSFDNTRVYNIVDSDYFYYIGVNSNERGGPAHPTGIRCDVCPPDPDQCHLCENALRLEIFNLVRNGGFEPALDPLEAPLLGWRALPTPAIAKILPQDPDPDHFTSTTGQLLLYEFQPITDVEPLYWRIEFDLGTVRDTFIPRINYMIRLSFYKYAPTSVMPVMFNNEIRAVPQSAGGLPWTKTRFPDPVQPVMAEVTAATGPNTFSILHDHNNPEGYIDDFRIIRSSNIDYNLRLIVPFSEAGRPNLHSGRYRFSAYFKAEANNDVNPHPSNKNRFRSSNVSLGLGSSGRAPIYRITDASDLSSTSWTRISIEQFFHIRDGEHLILLIAPTDKTHHHTWDIGSVLIALPELYFISE